MFSINLKRSATVLAVTAGLFASAVPAGASAAERDNSVPRSTVKSDSNDVIDRGPGRRAATPPASTTTASPS